MSTSPLGRILKSINLKSELIDEEYIAAEYVPFVINRSLSYILDVMFFAHSMSENHDMPVYDQYLWYYHKVPRMARFARWQKFDPPKYLDVVKEYYGYSTGKALSALNILSVGQCIALERRLDKGGKESCKNMTSSVDTASK